MIRLYEYNLPFKEPLTTGSAQYIKRTGLIIRYTGSECDTVSEISPLPPFSSESIPEIIIGLKSSKKDLEDFLKRDYTLDELNQFIKNFTGISSLRYGLSWLGATLFDSRNKGTINSFFNSIPGRTVLVNDLIGSTEPDLLREKLLSSIESGFRTIKIKCLTPNQDTAEAIRSVTTLHSEIKIRLDANLSWNSDSVELFNSHYHDLPIEYIEEPFQLGENGNRKLFKAPIAKDESIRNLETLSNLLSTDNNLFLVIKPMVFGTVFDLAETISTHRSMKRMIVISNLLESAVGRSYNLRFASHFGDPELAHGLNTGKYFKWDLMNEIPLDHGMIHTDQRLFQPIVFNQLKSDYLMEIDLANAD